MRDEGDPLSLRLLLATFRVRPMRADDGLWQIAAPRLWERERGHRRRRAHRP